MTEYGDGNTLDGGGFEDYDEGAAVDGGSFGEPDATPLEKMRAFIARYPHGDALENLQIDYTDKVPNCGGLFPSGLVEVRRRTDLLGNVTAENQLNFALYAMMAKAPGDDAGATVNAEWGAGLQEWVQEQSAIGNAPTFGDEPHTERITAQNGAIYSADDEGWAVYAIQISAAYTKRFERS